MVASLNSLNLDVYVLGNSFLAIRVFILSAIRVFILSAICSPVWNIKKIVSGFKDKGKNR